MRPAENVQDLIDLLNIDVIGREVEAVHNLIRESYVVPYPIADSFDDFKAIVTHYYQYHFSMWYGIEFDMEPDMAWGRVTNILRNMPRPDARLSRISTYLDAQGSWNQAIINTLTGRHGGLISVIDQIAEAMKADAVKQYVTAVFLDCINPLNFETKVLFAQQYLERYGHMVLPGEELLSPYELAAQLEPVIEQHVRLINEFRHTLQ